MTDLPFGRGGSPMQNLIVRKIYETKIAALRAEKGMDTGPVYLKRDLDISTGSANEILSRVSDVIFNDMIPAFLNAEKHLAPRPQQGATTVFSRRTPQDSDMRSAAMQTTQDLYDFVRMLDGEGYPPAFIKAGRLKLILKNAERHGTKITGTFEAVENDCE
jgi:methionyl-tRNA formyltransferase